jgi:hypothetical protein
MVKSRDNDASIKRSNVVVVLVIYAAVLGIPYVCGKVYRRWIQNNRPLEQLWTSLDRLGDSYRGKRANVTEVGEVISGVMGEIARATSTRRAR